MFDPPNLTNDGALGALVAISPCYACKQPFAFDPDTVASIYVDPETGLPPDVEPIRPGGRDRAKREPICPNCRKSVTLQNGFDPWGGK